MAIALATIRTDVYSTIYNHIQTGTYALTSSNIHPAYNDLQLRSEGYPQIIIKDILIPESKVTFGDSGLYECNVSFKIEIHHSSAANARTVTDEVASKFRGDGRIFLDSEGLSSLRIDNEDYDSIPYAQSKTHYINSLTYKAHFMSSD